MQRITFILIAIVGLIASPAAPGVGGKAFAQDREAFQRSPEDQRRAERRLAEYIRARTNRRAADLVERTGRGGTVTVDLADRYQHLVLAKVDPDGSVTDGCVATPGQANAFYERDLETGEPVRTSLFTTQDINGQAAQHGMSGDEYATYSKMAEKASTSNMTASTSSATITIVNADEPGEGFNDPTPAAPEGGNTGTTLGQQRLNVFNHAARIWAEYLDTGVNIEIRAKFDPLPCSQTSAVLGSAGTTTVHRNFSNARLQGTWYPQALANKMAGSDLSSNPDINTTFNSAISGDASCLNGQRFYLGLDNVTPAGTSNLLITVLHEIGHGVGFASYVNETDGKFFNGYPDVFSTFIFDRTANKLWKDMTDAERTTSAINSNNVLWDGPSVRIGSGHLLSGRDAATGRVELFAPNPVNEGSSISHFNMRVFPNVLMEPNLTLNLPLTLDLTRQAMRDIGWYRDTTADLQPDSITDVSPGGPNLVPGSRATVTWTNTGGFDQNVTIELSTDGGATFPFVLAADAANSGSHTFTVPAQTTARARIRVREHGFAEPAGTTAADFSISTSTGTVAGAVFDFDGDRRTDVSVYRAGQGEWWYLRSSDGGNRAFRFGLATDRPVPADYTGDGRTDPAFFRASTNEWFVLRSEDATFYSFPFGAAGDVPAPGDFDGDGRADAAVFRPSTSTWYVSRSTDGGTSIENFGVAGDRPVVADYDGDGRDDIAIYRPSVSEWWINRSTDGVVAYRFGQSGDRTAQGDWTGDGRADIAFWRPSTGFWFVLRSEDSSFYGFPFGANGDIPSPGDYDGDGRTDAAVYRPSAATWYVSGSTNGTQVTSFGSQTDTPLPSVYSVQ